MATTAPFPLLSSSPTPNSPISHQRQAILRSLNSPKSLSQIHQFHSQLIRLGLSVDNDAVGRLLKLLAHSPDPLSLPYALRLLRSLPNPDNFVFNTLLRSPLPPSESLQLYSHMLSLLPPNSFTFPSLLRALSDNPDNLFAGTQLHAHVIKFGFHDNLFSQNNLIHFYLCCGLPAEARKVFDGMGNSDVVSWTSLISGLAKLGFVDDARRVFDEMPERNSVSWNAMIAGYVQGGRFKEGVQLFKEMQERGILIDKFVAASMLAACTGLGALQMGMSIHEHMERSGVEMDSKLATTLIDMYCKCGGLDRAYEVFRELSVKGLSSWNCMIGGFAMHGRGKDAIKLFREMEKEEVVPDDITLLNLLSACAHVGMVDEGRYYFQYMVGEYGIEPKMEHYGCMVDLLGRAGKLEEAKKFIDEMPMNPDAGVLGALVGACKVHGNVDLGEQIGRRVIELDPLNSGRYVLLANLLATSGKWDDVAHVRKMMNDRGVNKEPGCSMIEMEGMVYEFIAGGRSHPEAREIYAKVEEMLEKIRSEGYVVNIGGVLHDIDDEEKENPLFYHSEKLAIAYGLLKSIPGDTLRISKNLRVCKDCHEASKFISRVYNREIIVRDRNRFHHFRGGECSCKDFW